MKPIVNKPPKGQGPNKNGGIKATGGGGRNRKPKRYGAVGGYRGVNVKQAENIVNRQMQSLIRQLNQQKQGVNHDTQQAVGQANDLYGRTKGDLDHIFGEVSGYMGQMGDKIHSQYGSAMDKVGQMNTALTGQLMSDSDAHQQAAMAEMQRLGIQQTGMDPRYQADARFAQNVSQQTGANEQANLQMMQANGDQISQLLGGMAQGSHSSSLGQAMNVRNADITDIRSDKRDQLRDIMNQIINVRKDQPSALNDLLMQMQGQGFDQWSQLQGIKLDRRSLAAQIQAQRAAAAQASAEAAMGAGLWSNAARGDYPDGVNPNGYYNGPAGTESSYGPNNVPHKPHGKKPPKVRHGSLDDYNSGLWGWTG